MIDSTGLEAKDYKVLKEIVKKNYSYCPQGLKEISLSILSGHEAIKSYSVRHG